jgi:hypothetical protein
MQISPAFARLAERRAKRGHIGPHHVDARGVERDTLVLDDHGTDAAKHR